MSCHGEQKLQSGMATHVRDANLGRQYSVVVTCNADLATTAVLDSDHAKWEQQMRALTTLVGVLGTATVNRLWDIGYRYQRKQGMGS